MKRFSENKGCRTEVVFDPDTTSFGYRTEPIPMPGAAAAPEFSPADDMPSDTSPASVDPASTASVAALDSSVKAPLPARPRQRGRFTLASRNL